MLWMSLAATLVTGVAALSAGPPGGSGGAWALVAVAGLAYLASTACWLSTVRGGEVSLVTPIIACDGALAALLAVATGETLSATAAVALIAMVLALLLVARENGAPAVAGEARFAMTVERSKRMTVFLAFMTAVFFAIVFFTSGKVEGISPLWIVAVARIFPCVYALALCLRDGSLLPPWPTWHWILICGITDAAAYVCYIFAARGVLAVAAIAASQYAAVAAVGGVLLLKERLLPSQWLGVVVLLLAAAAIAGEGGG